MGRARPTLPVSTVRRARVVEALEPATILCVDDVDGMSLLLAQRFDVSTWSEDAGVRAWLDEEARALGVRLTVCEEQPAAGPCFGALTSTFGTPRTNYELLQLAARQVREGGLIIAQLRAPWEAATFAILQGAGMPVLQHWREVDHAVLPTGLVVDGAGDVLVVERTLAAPRHIEDARAESMRAQPYFCLDFDGLGDACRDPAALDRLLDSVVSHGGYREVMRTVTRSGERVLAAWAAAEGESVTAHLNPGAEHILVALMGYDERLEQAAMCAVAEQLAGPHTRMRSQRTGLHRGESIVA